MSAAFAERESSTAGLRQLLDEAVAGRGGALFLVGEAGLGKSRLGWELEKYVDGLAATVQTKTVVPCQPCHRPVCTMNDHRCMRDIPASDVADEVMELIAQAAH